MTLTQIKRMPTGCPGLDHVLAGGLPEGRSTLVSGTAGSGKTVLALQFLHDGLRDYEQPGVFITFEERPEQLRANAASLGFDIAKLEEQGKWLFVDASYSPDRDEQQVGPFDFGALLLRLRHAVEQVGATRVALDSIGAVFTRYQDANVVRRELMRVTELLRERCHRGGDQRAGRGVRPDRPPRCRGVRLRQRDRAAQRTGGGDPPPHHRGAEDARRGPPDR